MDENKNGWYDQSAASDWYDVSDKCAIVSPSAPHKETKKPRKKRTGLKITLIIVLVLMLIAGSVFIFAEGVNNFKDFAISIQGLYENFDDADDIEDFFPEFDGDFDIIIPGEDNIPLLPDEGKNPDNGDFPDDFRDFFDNYYIAEETIEPSNLERAEATGDFTLDL